MARNTKAISVEQARALASQWEAQYEEHLRTSAISNRFRGATPSEVIRMWESCRNERGQKLTQVEVVALVERWLEQSGISATMTGTKPATQRDRTKRPRR